MEHQTTFDQFSADHEVRKMARRTDHPSSKVAAREHVERGSAKSNRVASSNNRSCNTPPDERSHRTRVDPGGCGDTSNEVEKC
jgi:hypothetical protein